MTDLTEQWKKGELPDGFYYFKLPDGSTDIASEYKMIRYRLTKDADKVEVLAPVPTYQEYLESESHCAVYSDINKWLKEENQQLKELLRECRPYISRSATSRMIKNSAGYKKDMKLLTKIEEVLK